MLILYNVLLIVLSPVWLIWMVVRARQRKEPPNWNERMGIYSLPGGKEKRRIWVHAVSVGEVVASLPILAEVKKLLPTHEIVLSVTTSSGRQTAEEKAREFVDHIVYFPIDLPRFTLTALSRVRPEVVAVMETELWMNFLWTSQQIGAKTMLINGRISDRSFRRSGWIRPYYRALFKYLDRALMQSDGDMTRIKALGAKSAEVFGNCKFDQAVDGSRADRSEWRSQIGAAESDFVVVVGSTRSELEERLVIDALADLPIRIVYAPRHLERAPQIAEYASQKIGPVSYRSRQESGPFLLLDTYGELSQIYAAADVVIIGGGFDELGGQNLIQPLAHGVPVLHGPHMQNFRDAAAMAGEAGATRICATSEELRAAVHELLANPELRQLMGEAAKSLVQGQIGASRRYAEAIRDAAMG